MQIKIKKMLITNDW